MNNDNAMKKSITKRLSLYMSLLITTILIGGILLYVSEHAVRDRYESRLTLLEQKADLSAQIQAGFTGSVAELRGYMAIRQPEFKDKLKARQDSMTAAMDSFSKLSLDADDKKYLDDIKGPVAQFYNSIAPMGIKLADEGNTAEMIRLSKDPNYVQQTDSVRKRNADFATKTRETIRDTQAAYSQKLNVLTILLSLYFILTGGVVGFLAIRLARGIGTPLRMLALFSNQEEPDLQKHPIFRLGYATREDEIGYLTRSLQEMLTRIDQSEKDLIEQNDELLAQQEELITQQDELHTALMKMEENEGILEAQNRLNESLVNTLDRDELLQSIISNLVVIQDADKGAIVLLEPGHPHASVGIKPEQMEAWIHTVDEGIFTRIQQEGKLYSVKREANRGENGYHHEAFHLEDLYMPILSHKGKVVAVVVLTRLGRSFHDDAKAQAVALANQISLSIEKLRTYEESERSRMLNQEILDSVREGIQYFDEDGMLVQVNKTFCTWMEQEPSAFAGDGTDCMFHLFEDRVENAAELIAFIQHALDGRIPEDEKMIYELHDGEKRMIQVYYEKITDTEGVNRGTVLVHRDMTREYEVDQMKSEFVSTVSHELRTPLSSVLGFTELMLNKELKPERQKKYLTTIHKEAKRLTQLINDFLDIQRMESGRQVYEMTEVDLIPIAEETIETLSMSTQKHVLKVDTTLRHAIVYGDEHKLKQVLVNLISNAIKYSPDGGEVGVRFRENEGQIEVDITDQGLGIPKEALGKLFSKFYRIDNSDRREIGGTGLGLAICKEIMKAHGGTITVESALGAGSTFRLHFANVVRLEKRELVAVPAAAAEEASDKPRLLIIEDDDSLAMLLREEMQENGFQVTHVHDGEQALAWTRENTPDAIVLDIMLKDSISGWEVIEGLKQDGGTTQIPIFIATALDEKERGMSLGASEYLTKPYQPGKLSNMILQMLLRKEKNGVIMVPDEDALKHEL